MTAIEMVQRLHRHRAWVNHNLLDAATCLDLEQLHATFQIGQGSVWQSLLHLYAAEYSWLEALLGNDDPVVPGDLPGKMVGNQQADGGIRTLDELRQRWSALEQRWDGYLASLTPAALLETVNKTSVVLGPGKRWETRRYDVLLHVCIHAQYTAAQVVNMFRQSGAALPQTMLTTMARQEAS